MLCLGRDDAEVARRADAVGRDVAEVRENCLAGTPGEIVDRLGTWAERTGTTRVYLQILDLSDLDHLEDFASLVVPEIS
jgi:alkanesulfonate monooxygenase